MASLAHCINPYTDIMLSPEIILSPGHPRLGSENLSLQVKGVSRSAALCPSVQQAKRDYTIRNGILQLT